MALAVKKSMDQLGIPVTLKTAAVAVGLYILGSYVWDVWIRPKKEALKAKNRAKQLKKPMLNVGAGTPDSSLRAALLGPQLAGDVNVDISAPKGTPHGPDRVSHADVQDLPFKDKEFGVAYTSHLLEHVDDPQKALSELHRVADEVVNVTPRWWAPHTWLYPDHKWYVSGDQKTFIPLWSRSKAAQAARSRAQANGKLRPIRTARRA